MNSYSGVKVYETATRKLLAEYAENGTAVALSPDGNRVAVHKSGHIRVFDIDAEKLVADEAFEPELGFARSLAFGPDGKKLVAQPPNGLMLFDALSKDKPKPIYLDSSGFVPSPDGKFLAAIRSKPARVAVIDVDKGQEVAKFETKSPTAIAWSPDGKRVGTADGLTLHVWSAKTGKPLLRRIGHDDQIQAIAFAPDGKTVVTGGKDNLVYAWTLPESETK